MYVGVKYLWIFFLTETPGIQRLGQTYAGLHSHQQVKIQISVVSKIHFTEQV